MTTHTVKPPSKSAARAAGQKKVGRLTFTRWPIDAATSLSVHLGPDDDRCGIYIMEFSGKEAPARWYVGQSIDVVQRFAQHCHQDWQDVTAISFCPVPREDLDFFEMATLHELEYQGKTTRNIRGAGRNAGRSELDVIIDRAEQNDWLTGGDDPEDEGLPRYLVARSRVEHRARFLELSSRPDYPTILGMLAGYVRQIMPVPAQTEGHCWTATSLPKTGRRKDWHRLACINIQNVEALVIGESFEENEWGLFGFFNAGFVRDEEVESFAERVGKYGAIVSDTDNYRSAGPVEQIQFIADTDFSGLLAEPPVRDAARHFAVHQMRKGTSIFRQYHDPNLADDILAAIIMGTPDAH